MSAITSHGIRFRGATSGVIAFLLRAAHQLGLVLRNCLYVWYVWYLSQPMCRLGISLEQGGAYSWNPLLSAQVDTPLIKHWSSARPEDL